MKKITDIFKNKERTFSFEFFPPKTEQGYKNLLTTIGELSELEPDFISVTYGAGGGNREKTFDLIKHIQDEHQIVGLHHLTCVLHTKSDIKKFLNQFQDANIRNVLALRGDPPLSNPDWKPGDDNFHYSSELCRFIRDNYDDFFSLGVAGFPEGHILAPSLEFDRKVLKAKIDNGGDFVISQLFFDNQKYFDYVNKLKDIDVNVRVIPGILPITNYAGAVSFCEKCGVSIPDEIRQLFEPLASNPEKTLEAGTEFAIRQCQELLSGGAPGIHLYTLNKTEPARTIFQNLRSLI